mmetsp:Transcript_41529/g.81450  ORF Transcript_41529/g.81450 Transcript_41529/m.81450 type:complete len:94 (-) Transcript_41529:1588-1869(-)
MQTVNVGNDGRGQAELLEVGKDFDMRLQLLKTKKDHDRGQMMRTSGKTQQVLAAQTKHTKVREFTFEFVELPLAAQALASRQDISVPAWAWRS